MSKYSTSRSLVLREEEVEKAEVWMGRYRLLEKAMAPHSSTLAWKIPWMEEPGRLQSMGSLRVGYDWANSLSLFTFMVWRRKWQPTPVFLPGESQGRGSLVGCTVYGVAQSRTWLKWLSSSSAVINIESRDHMGMVLLPRSHWHFLTQKKIRNRALFHMTSCSFHIISLILTTGICGFTHYWLVWMS